MNLIPEYVEKDYWITYALFTVFTNEIGKDIVFKGGTSLSKCYQMIERFSEDIDLVVFRREGETDNRLKSKLKAVSRIVETHLPEVQFQGITRKMGMNRKTAHSYHKEFQDDYGEVRDLIILESTWLGYFEPYTTKSINSFIGQTLLANKQFDIAQEFGLHPFDAFVLEPIRTICEKIMSLVRFSYSENPIKDLKNKVRHTYDLHQLLRQEIFLNFFNSSAFEQMVLKVAHDDVLSFRNNNKWLIYHPSEALIFKDLENVWLELKIAYSGKFRTLVFGEFPKEEEVIGTLRMIKQRLNGIPWNINMDDY